MSAVLDHVDLRRNLKRDLCWLVEQARAPRKRTMREFAEQEIVIPDGPAKGELFKCSRQPYSRLWFDAVDSGQWERHVVTGPTQSGKTLCCSIIPTLYHLFELEENVIYGIPDKNMVADKWESDLLPAIEASRYAELLPRRGSGSRGGAVGLRVNFRNGTTLRFMTGGGRDQSRAAFTSRVLVVTETEGFDRSSATSKEASQIEQLEGRLQAYRRYNPRKYFECTVTHSKGFTWSEYEAGTRSRIMQRCPYCGDYVCLGPEHLIGWAEAKTDLDAFDNGALACYSCGAVWSEGDRMKAAADSVLVHKGQEVIESGSVVGELPRTRTLGFRWSAADNLFVTAGDIAMDAWRAERAMKQEDGEKKMCQFVWALPYDPDEIDLTELEPDNIITRQAQKYPRGVVPKHTEYLTVFVDIGKFTSWYGVVAWLPNASPHIVDYGPIEVESKAFGVESALRAALMEFEENICAKGYPIEGADGVRKPNIVGVDCGWQRDIILEACRKYTNWVPFRGFGLSSEMPGKYNPPKDRNKTVLFIGDGCHIAMTGDSRARIVFSDADHWKTWLHERIKTPMDHPGALTLYYSDRTLDHMQLARHLCAETQTQEYVPGKGFATKWVRQQKANHYLDVFYGNCVAAHVLGARLVAEPKKEGEAKPKHKPETVATLTAPDGRAYLATER